MMIDEKASGEGSMPGLRAVGAMDAAPDRRGLSDHARRRIGTHLRTMYDTVVHQPVPDRFLELIAKLGEETGEDPGANRPADGM